MNSYKEDPSVLSPLRVCRDYHMRTASAAESAVRAVLLGLESAMSRFRKRAALAKEFEARYDLTEVPHSIRDSAQAIIEIKQGTVASSSDGTFMVRVRMSTEKGKDPEYTMTAKCYPTSDEAETEISKEIFEGFYPSLSRREVKTRYVWNGWDIDDIADGDRAGRKVAEFEHDGNSKVEIPAELSSVLKQGGGVNG